ncbi:MAG: AAA family ATPase [Candidatus Shapirobacteria bacterium]|jgi:energy-coupling factor transporter ATP-binding protein EcfA2
MTKENNFFIHGSQWLRADFHLHTRRDREFKDSGTEQDFVARYITALKQAGIRIGVITNHNKFDWDEYKALRKAAKREEIYLLPGVELSVKDGRNGIHTLVVFREDWIDSNENVDHINSFLGLTFAGQTGYDNKNARSNHDLVDTIRELDKFEKDYLLIFAHVEEANGLWGALGGGRITELGVNELFRSRTAAFQKVRTRTKREEIKSLLSAWYPSEVEGSDPKSISEIGHGEPTFIKIGAFTFEAIEFALKPGAERLSSEIVNKQAHSWVRSLRFEGGIMDGKQVDLSDEMNCLIGIRGSGKSAILESLRYALGLQLPDNTDDLDYKYKQDLVRFALGSGGKVIVEIEDALGQHYEIRRILNERADLYFDGELRPGVRIPLKNPLFFGQKELVKRGEGSERELVERLLGSKLDTVRSQIVTQRQRVLDVLANLDKLKDLDTIEQEYQNKKKDTEFRLNLFRKHGVEQQLQRQVEFNADVTQAHRVADAADIFVRSFETFLREQESELAALSRLESKENTDVIEDINVIFDRIRKAPEKARLVLKDAISETHALREKLGELEHRREMLKDDFAAIERQLSEQLQQTGIVSVRPDDFVKLNAELQKAILALDEIAKSRTRRNAFRDQLLKELRRLSDLWHQEFKEIETEIKKLNDSQTALHIIPLYKGDKAAFLKEMQDQFHGSKLRETTLKGVLDLHADFISVYESLDSICNGLGDSSDVFRRYFNESRASLLTWQVPNLFQIEYHGKELREHSLGQRASALILFILSQRDNDVIIIDQPEDDLDNQTIFEDVIKLIRYLKKDIQFIFATHNANFPVLGDAEQVGACAFVSGSADIQVGSIDEPGIQKAIVSIMEGGHEAFARRKEIYQLWKQ